MWQGREEIAVTNQIIISVFPAVVFQNNTTLFVLKNDLAMVLIYIYLLQL